MQVRASHILVDSKEQASVLKTQIVEGADFGLIAQTHSKCPSAAKGGDLGMFSDGMMVQPFQDAAFTTPVGQVSDPVQTQFGWHIIKRTA